MDKKACKIFRWDGYFRCINPDEMKLLLHHDEDVLFDM